MNETNESIKTVQEVVLENEHPVPLSIVDRLKAVNLTQKIVDSQILPPSQPGFEHKFGKIATFTQSFIKMPSAINRQIVEADGSNLQNSIPDLVGIPGAQTKDINPPMYDMFNTTLLQLEEAERTQTLAIVAAVGAVAAATVYVMLNTPKPRYD